MLDTLIFIWIDKRYLNQVIDYYENQNIKYVESIVCVALDEDKVRENKFIENNSTDKIINLNNSLVKSKSFYFSNSKKTILIFRYVS